MPKPPPPLGDPDGGRRRPHPHHHPAAALGAKDQLTPREARVLADILKGFSNTDITHRQLISVNTIKSYIRTSHRKTGVTTRAQAVSWGIRNGFATAGSERPLPMARTTQLAMMQVTSVNQ
jgi:DNA-binding CsgD family transcriptional regulator